MFPILFLILFKVCIIFFLDTKRNKKSRLHTKKH